MKKGFLINEFPELKELLDTVESIDGIDLPRTSSTATSRRARPTSAPMRASVHGLLPNLTADGTDKGAKAVAGRSASVRGTGGEHADRQGRHRRHLAARAPLHQGGGDHRRAVRRVSKLLAAEKLRALPAARRRREAAAPAPAEAAEEPGRRRRLRLAPAAEEAAAPRRRRLAK